MSHYAAIKKTDIANGIGVRVSVFLSGCPIHCEGCFNYEAWNPSYGNPLTFAEQNEIMDALQRPYIEGLSLLGGEPTAPYNIECARFLARLAHAVGKTVWCYSGYTFEHLMQDERTRRFLHEIDVLVDGPYVKELSDITLLFRGSSNQRIIDVPQSLHTNTIVLWDGRHANH